MHAARPLTPSRSGPDAQRVPVPQPGPWPDPQPDPDTEPVREPVPEPEPEPEPEPVAGGQLPAADTSENRPSDSRTSASGRPSSRRTRFVPRTSETTL